MKILHVIESGGFYGAERVLVELVLGLRELQHDCLVVSIGRTKETASALETILRGYNIEFVPLQVSIKDSFFINKQILKFATQHDCEIVHSHSYKSNILLALINRKNRPVPFCCTIHGYVAAKTFSRMWLYQWLDKLSLCFMQHVFLVSKQMLQLSIISELESSKCTVVENGIGGYQSASVNVDASVLEFIEQKDNKFIAVGRLALEKGFDILVRAFSEAFKDSETAVLVIFGDGPERNKLQAMINDLQLEKRVLLFGFSSNVTSYFKYFNHFVMSSLTEGSPISLLEAMYAEMDCIATKVGSIPQMLDDGKVGLLIEANSVDELTRSLKNAELYKGVEAKKYAMEHYSHIRMANLYLNTYLSLCSKVSSHH